LGEEEAEEVLVLEEGEVGDLIAAVVQDLEVRTLLRRLLDEGPPLSAITASSYLVLARLGRLQAS
jgi:hypothetical protein